MDRKLVQRYFEVCRFKLLVEVRGRVKRMSVRHKLDSLVRGEEPSERNGPTVLRCGVLRGR